MITNVWKNKEMFQTTNQLWIEERQSRWEDQWNWFERSSIDKGGSARFSIESIHFEVLKGLDLELG